MTIEKNAKNIALDKSSADGRAENACCGPIRVVRTSQFTLVILFDESLFTKELLPITLRGCLRGQNLWKLYETDANLYPGYTTFLIQVENHLAGEELEKTMGHVVETTTKAAYRQELHRKHRKVPITKLPFIHMQARKEIAPVSRKAARVLQLAGYATLQDLAWATREELCEIPGMSTRDVFDVELNLAAMGFSLMIPAVPAWDGAAKKLERRFSEGTDDAGNPE